MINTGPWPSGIANDDEAIIRLQDILLQLAEGERGEELDQEYREIRSAFLENSEYNDVIPRLVRIHRNLGGMWPYMKNFDATWEPRRKHVRDELDPLFARAEHLAKKSTDANPPWPATPPSTDATDWTGMQSRAQRLATARSLLPVARGSIERLIEDLSKPPHNGGPPLSETTEALDNLRKLHRSLGEILDAVEGNNWSAIEQQGLPAEAARYAKRFARSVRYDPMPYASAALLLCVLSACGLPGIAGALSGVALTVSKGPQTGSGKQ